MKIVLCLVLCLGFAIARNDEWRDRRSHQRNFNDIEELTNTLWGRNSERSRNNWWQTSNDDETTGICHVSGRKVNTFRNVEVNVPSTTEYVVLSKDCSTNPSFVVAIRKLTHGTDLKELKIKTRQHKIVLTPLSQSGEQLKITVNDRPVRIHEDIELKENGYPVIRIIKEGSQIKVELMNKGVHVVFDGYTCQVELSQVSRKNMCGLCGQTDSDEFRTRDFTNTEEFYGQDEDTEYPEDKDFDDDYTCSNKRQWWGSDDRTCQKNRRQWGYDKPECNYGESDYDCKYNTRENSEWTRDQSDEYEPEYKRRQCQSEYKPFESEFDSEYKPFNSEFESEYKPFESRFNSRKNPEWIHERSEEYETDFDQSTSGQKRLVLKHKLVDLEDKICVSLQRIPQCPVNTRPVNKVQKRVSFHCINRNDRRVTKFENRIHSGKRIPEIERLTPTMTRTVVVPTKCTKSFY